MMRIKADQELKNIEDKIKMLTGNYTTLKRNVESLENRLDKIRTNNATISQTPNSLRKHIDLHVENATLYGQLEMPESRKQEYFNSAGSAAVEIGWISEDVEIMLVEQKLSWQTVAMGGMASFASSSQPGLDKLNELIDIGKLMLFALEYGRISPKDLTGEMVSSLKFAYKAAYGVGVYHFKSEDREKVQPHQQKSIDYLIMAMKFDAYYLLNNPKESFEGMYGRIKESLEHYSGGYDVLISDIELRKDSFEQRAEEFLSTLKTNETLKNTATDARRF